jgi:hypothetical protein
MRAFVSDLAANWSSRTSIFDHRRDRDGAFLVFQRGNDFVAAFWVNADVEMKTFGLSR